MSNQAVRDKRYSDNMKARGFRKCILWVHDEDRAQLQNYAKKLKDKRK